MKEDSFNFLGNHTFKVPLLFKILYLLDLETRTQAFVGPISLLVSLTLGISYS